MYHVDNNWTPMDLIKASFASWFCGLMVSTLDLNPRIRVQISAEPFKGENFSPF